MPTMNQLTKSLLKVWFPIVTIGSDYGDASTSLPCAVSSDAYCAVIPRFAESVDARCALLNGELGKYIMWSPSESSQVRSFGIQARAPGWFLRSLVSLGANRFYTAMSKGRGRLGRRRQRSKTDYKDDNTKTGFSCKPAGVNLTLYLLPNTFFSFSLLYETYENLWHFIWRMERHVILWPI